MRLTLRTRVHNKQITYKYNIIRKSPNQPKRALITLTDKDCDKTANVLTQ